MAAPLYDMIGAEPMPARSKARMVKSVRETLHQAAMASHFDGYLKGESKSYDSSLEVVPGYSQEDIVGSGLANFSSKRMTESRLNKLRERFESIEENAEVVKADEYGPLAYPDMHRGRKNHEKWGPRFTLFNSILPESSWMRLPTKAASSQYVGLNGVNLVNTPATRRMPKIPPTKKNGMYNVIAGTPYSGLRKEDIGSGRDVEMFRNEMTYDVLKALHMLLVPESRAVLFYPSRGAEENEKIRAKIDITSTTIIESLINGRARYAVAANLDPHIVTLDFDACITPAFFAKTADGKNFVQHFCEVTGGKVLLTSMSGRDDSGHVMVVYPSVEKAILAANSSKGILRNKMWRQLLDLDQEKTVGKYVRKAGVDVLHSPFGADGRRGNQMVRLPFSPNKPNGMSNTHANASWLVAPFAAGPSTVTDIEPDTSPYEMSYKGGVSMDVRELGEILTNRYNKVAEAFAADGVDYTPPLGPRNVSEAFKRYAKDTLEYYENNPLTLEDVKPIEPENVMSTIHSMSDSGAASAIQNAGSGLSEHAKKVLSVRPGTGDRSDYAIIAFNAYVAGKDVSRIDPEEMYDIIIDYPAFEKLREKPRSWGVAWLSRELEGTALYRAENNSDVGQNNVFESDSERQDKFEFTDYNPRYYDEYDINHPVQRLRPWMVKFIAAVTKDASLNMPRHVAAAICLAGLFDQSNWEIYSVVGGRRPMALYSAISIERTKLVIGSATVGSSWSRMTDPRRAVADEGLAEYVSGYGYRKGETRHDVMALQDEAALNVSQTTFDPDRYGIDIYDESVDERDLALVAGAISSPLTLSMAGAEVLLYEMVRRDFASTGTPPRVTAAMLYDRYGHHTSGRYRSTPRTYLNDMKRLVDLGLVDFEETNGFAIDAPFTFASRNTNQRAKQARLAQVRHAAACLSVARRNIAHLSTLRHQAIVEYVREKEAILKELPEDASRFDRTENGRSVYMARTDMLKKMRRVAAKMRHARRVFWQLIVMFKDDFPHLFDYQSRRKEYGEALRVRQNYLRYLEEKERRQRPRGPAPGKRREEVSVAA